jgi:predicted P-loop ATPase
MLLAAVWRVLKPEDPTKVCVIFSGAQTLFKSEALRQLCGPQWFTDTRQSQDKDTLLALHACWFYELGEIDALMDKRHAGDLKNLISPVSDSFRPPFWRAMCRFMRTSIFVGTTNRRDFFTDETGAHRYPVVEINEPIDLKGIKENRDRIWKAALKCFRDKEKPWLTRKELAQSDERNQDFHQQDPWAKKVQDWLDGTVVVTGRTKEGVPITE